MVLTLRWLDHECFVYVFDGCLRRVSECLGLSQGGTATKTNRRDIEPDYELMPGPKIRAASGDGEPKQRIADRAMQQLLHNVKRVKNCKAAPFARAWVAGHRVFSGGFAAF